MKRLMTLAMLSTILAALALLGIPASAQGSDPCIEAQSGIVPDGFELVFAPNQGGSGSQVILGTEGPDVLEGGSGADILCGFGGYDVLDGGSGDDYLDAGTGYHELYGGSGRDTLIGMRGGVFDDGSGNGEIIRNEPGSVVNVAFRQAGTPDYCFADVQLSGFAPNTLFTAQTYLALEPNPSERESDFNSQFEVQTDGTGNAIFTDYSNEVPIVDGRYFQVRIDGTPMTDWVRVLCG